MPTPPDREAAVTSPRPATVPGRDLADVATRAGATVATRSGSDANVAVPQGIDVVVTGVTLDSRSVRPGDLYAALPGARAHGADFAAQAADRGAVAVLTDPAGSERAARTGLPVLVTVQPRAVLGDLAGWVYDDPAASLLLLGVTGTNGKTTTCFLLDAALRAAGYGTGLIGTVETRVLQQRVPSVRTTPESPDLHALLAVMREQGVGACSMEVSSHALALHRVDGLRFDVVAFTNLSQDHLDFHGGLDEYFAAKASLFDPARADRGVVCVDDDWGRRLAATAQIPVVTVSTVPVAGRLPDDQQVPDWQVVDRQVQDAGRTAFTLRSAAGRELRAVCPLPGDFNVANTAVALLVLLEAGVDPDLAARGLAGGDAVPGRMERVPAAGGPLAVVDYAHTPMAVEVALTALRPATTGRLAVVLGAGGDRDPGKREQMGEAAARTADLVVVTDDNPRSEDPAQVRAAVLAGARRAAETSGAVVVEVADRRQAVLEAVRQAAAPGDTVLVAGKGHETGQEVGDRVLPFDDRVVLAEALEQVLATGGEVAR